MDWSTWWPVAVIAGLAIAWLSNLIGRAQGWWRGYRDGFLAGLNIYPRVRAKIERWKQMTDGEVIKEIRVEVERDNTRENKRCQG